MISQPEVVKLIRQTRQYEYSDGLRDLQMAVLLGIGGVAVWIGLEPIWINVRWKNGKSHGAMGGMDGSSTGHSTPVGRMGNASPDGLSPTTLAVA